MSLVLRRPASFVAVFGAGVATLCVLVAPLAGVDPTLGVEAAGAGLLVAWVVVGARSLVRAWLLARRLNRLAERRLIAGLECRVIRGGGRHAFVLGAMQPRIFVGDGLLDALDADELNAVLLHEDHHRRTRAPLRAAAIDAWLPFLGGWAGARSTMVDRLVDLEEEADAGAIRHGVRPADLASALLKSDRAPNLAAAFSNASDRRLRALLANADGAAADGAAAHDSTRLPYEWLPAIAVGVITVACHLAGITRIALG